ncbi:MULTISPECIES: cryptochrome/photolyase family protein [Pacificibacter]|uniref:cryptochrome/photolyase family protein n=1 Tax=Pacificibacter TaxID=1042323 RepID=UPI001C08596B|nr:MULTISPECIES: deoxyribodipyrimidine photo-lyase [Pacificibacter]MBU2936900.1 DNA photolyase family protein [Pacificibacter marinus]MDO6614894.1 deoxyribodipyrimidine photo-lyase [Pacificibacter sp. 1_MG-2023]
MTALWWIRRDMRLADNPALCAAVRAGDVIPVFIRDGIVDALGAAPKWRMGLGLEHLQDQLKALGGDVVLRSGEPRDVLVQLAQETGATSVFWSRLYDAGCIARDTDVKSNLQAHDVEAQSLAGHLLFEPWSVETKQGGFYKVYTPYWNAVKQRDVDAALSIPVLKFAPMPASEALEDWQLGAAMKRGADVVIHHVHVGETAAQTRLARFIEDHIGHYKARRDFPAEPVCSGLSENLTYGEISPRQIWRAAQRALEEGAAGAEHFLKELVWREFAYHLLYHRPDLPTENYRSHWGDFPWNTDASRPDVERWRRGQTGIKFVDAAMRELYVTGTMHNRARMIVASYLTKHLMTDWRLGRAWFEDCLIDWDPAANAMGWQWVAGCGPDASPYFRIFNPDGQIEKFDKQGVYLGRWLAEGQVHPSETALSYYDAIPKSWSLAPQDSYPKPIATLNEGRLRALDAYSVLPKSA